MKDLKDCKLYAILDRELLKEKGLLDAAKKLISGGVDLIQYRDKVSSLEEILENSVKLSKLNFPLIINDYAEIAEQVNAAGVHLGQGDMSVLAARKMLGKDKIVGCSATNLKQALQAEKEGADYIGIGPVFSTDTKKNAASPIGLEVVKEVCNNIKIPVFAIGGINLGNIDGLLKSGTGRIAVASALLKSGDIKKAVNNFVKKMEPLGLKPEVPFAPY